MVVLAGAQGIAAAVLAAGTLGQGMPNDANLIYDLELFRASSATQVITAPASGPIAHESIDLMVWCIAPPPRIAGDEPLVHEAPVLDDGAPTTIALR